MSTRELESRSGVARSTIGRLERGLRRPRASTLGWLAWGMDAENVMPLTRQLTDAAADSLIAESRWSERMHARHAAAALYACTLPVPAVLLAPRAVAAFGTVLPGDLDRLRQVEAMAHEIPWPPGMEGSQQALAVANEIADMRRSKLAEVGRAAGKLNDFGALKARQQLSRKRKAAEREIFQQSGGPARLKLKRKRGW